MKVEKKVLEKSQIELTVELPYGNIEKAIPFATEKISKEVKIDGFRQGKVPYEVLKEKIGENAILEEAARTVINKTLGKAIEENIKETPIGQPNIDIIKLAENNVFIYKITIALMPSVTLGVFKDLKVKKEKVKIEKEDVDKTLEELQNMRVKEVLVDRKSKKGDKVLVDIQMFLDNVPVESGQGKDTAVIIGKDFIVPGFDKNLIDAKKSELKEFSLPYPKDHYMKNLAGKNVDFKVTIKEVYERQVPELDDEFAKTLGLKKISELEENLEKNIKEEREKESMMKSEKIILEKIIKKAKFGEIPELLIDNETKTMMAELEQNVTKQGANFDDYIKSMGKTRGQLMLDLVPDALKRVKVSLLMREISKKEKIEASQKDLEKYIDNLKKQYVGDEEILKRIDSPEYKSYSLNMLTSEKVVKEIRKWNLVD